MPSKGSVVFWFNTFSDGSPDYSTAHEECPVVLDQKLSNFPSLLHAYRSWERTDRANSTVSIQKFRFIDQFKARKCLLRPKQRLQVLVNGRVSLRFSLQLYKWACNSSKGTPILGLPSSKGSGSRSNRRGGVWARDGMFAKFDISFEFSRHVHKINGIWTSFSSPCLQPQWPKSLNFTIATFLNMHRAQTGT